MAGALVAADVGQVVNELLLPTPLRRITTPNQHIRIVVALLFWVGDSMCPTLAALHFLVTIVTARPAKRMPCKPVRVHAAQQQTKGQS